MCRVTIRCDTSRACYSFLICGVKAVLSLCFLSFPQSFLAVSLFSHSLAVVSLMWQQQKRCKDTILMQAGQTLAYCRQRAFFHL